MRPIIYYLCLCLLISTILACRAKGPKIDLRPYLAPDSAFNNKSYRYINKMDGSAEFSVYTRNRIAEGFLLIEEHYNKDSVTGFIAQWDIGEKGMSFVRLSITMRNQTGQIRVVEPQLKNEAKYDWEGYIDANNPIFTMETSLDMGKLNTTQKNLTLASTVDEFLLRHLDSIKLPNRRVYYDCVETLSRGTSTLTSKLLFSQDKEILVDNERTIYAKGIGAVYTSYEDVHSSAVHKAFYLDTTIDGSKFSSLIK